MPLVPGEKLGPYEIVGPLGAGGMGEVYRARDHRLERDVAVKLLPDELAENKDRLRRFEEEAKAAGALNHPNLLTVHDVGTKEGVPYLVSELLEGSTLRDLLGAGNPLPLRKAIDYAAQIARGLAAAHDMGIVHRDLKPENLFVTQDGRAKILDFGLAKRNLPAQDVNSAVATGTLPTTPGTVLGTVGYMSPEQVQGLPADPRSDIFSFGAVLYEILTGRRAFRRDTRAETETAILRDDPPELLDLSRPVPPGVERITRRCLEKSPAQRFRSAHDLAFALEALSGSQASGLRAAAPPLPRWRGPVVGVGLALAALAVGLLVAPRVFVQPGPSFRPLTFRSGLVSQARFTPDGSAVVFSALWQTRRYELYSVRLDTPEPTPLGLSGAEILATSKTGQMAVKLRDDINPYRPGGTLATVPLTGGAPRKILQHVIAADFDRDGSLAVVHLDEDKGEWRVELPIGNVIYRSHAIVESMRLAPGGEHLALLLEEDPGHRGQAVFVLNRRGEEVARSDDWASVDSIAWSPRGDEVWFSAARQGLEAALYALSLRGRVRSLFQQAGSLLIADVSSDGRALVLQTAERRGIAGLFPGQAQELDLSWFDWSYARDISPDGRYVLFTEAGGGRFTGAGATYLRKTDGSPAVRLGEGASQALSPDGQWAVVLRTGPPPEVALLPTGPGQARTLPRGSLEAFSWPFRWLPDGKRILYNARESGHPRRAYLQDVAGGDPKAVAESLFLGPISPDGRFFVAEKQDGPLVLQPVEGGATRPIPGTSASDEDWPNTWSADGRSLYVVSGASIPGRIERLDLATGQRQLVREVSPVDPSGLLAVETILPTPDGRFYVYSQTRRLAQLYLVEGLR